MKSARQIVFIMIGAAMILLSVVLIFVKESNSVSGEGESGSKVFAMPISSLVFEAGACNIEILEGEGTEIIVDFDGLKYGTLITKQEEEKLKISYKQDKNWIARLFANKDEQQITLTVPKDVEFDSALFELGAAEITMEGITAKELTLTVGAGELKADRVTATEFAKFTVGAGSFSVEDANLVNTELECGVGEMKLGVYGEQEQYEGELNCGLGEIDFGTISIEGSGSKTYGTSSAERRMDIKCGIGEVDVRFNN